MRFIDNFPKGFTPRESQIDIIQKIEDAINSGFGNILLCAPTGIGKSHIALTIARSLGSSFIVTAQKILQDQYTKDFGFVYSAKGKQNFPCIDLYDTDKLSYDDAKKDPKLACTFGDCVKYSSASRKNESCRFKPTIPMFEIENKGTENERVLEPENQSCYYYIQKYQALLASHSSYNYASYFQTRLYSNGIEELLERNCIIADEAHEIEEQVIGFIGYNVIKKHLDAINLRFEDFDIESIDGVMDMIKVLADNYAIEVQKIQSTYGNYRTINSFKKRRDKFDKLYGRLKDNKENFVAQKTVNHFDGSFTLSIKPIDIGMYIQKFFDQRHRIFMSATIDKEIFCRNMGILESDCAFIEIEKSPFPAENRKVIFHNIRKLNVKSTPEDYAMIYSKIMDIVQNHPSEKGLILTTTKKHCNDISDLFPKRSIVAYEGEDVNREDALNNHKQSSTPSILVSPSFWFGVDLKDDLSRFQIILKAPYPSFADKRTRIKAEKYPLWYQYAALVKLLQGMGRSIRSEKDYAITHVLDESAYNLICRMRKYVPKAYYDVLGWKIPDTPSP